MSNRGRFSWSEALGDLAKSIGTSLLTGFGRLLGIGTVAALFGGVGGGVLAGVYGLPVVGSVIAGAVVAVVAVLALTLIFLVDW